MSQMDAKDTFELNLDQSEDALVRNSFGSKHNFSVSLKEAKIKLKKNLAQFNENVKKVTG